jgi:hypothetical protein
MLPALFTIGILQIGSGIDAQLGVARMTGHYSTQLLLLKWGSWTFYLSWV